MKHPLKFIHSESDLRWEGLGAGSEKLVGVLVYILYVISYSSRGPRSGLPQTCTGFLPKL